MTIPVTRLSVLQIANSLNNQELIIVGRGSLPWALSGPVLFLLDISRMQSFGSSSPGPFLMVVFPVSSLEGYSNVSLWDKEQVC